MFRKIEHRHNFKNFALFQTFHSIQLTCKEVAGNVTEDST